MVKASEYRCAIISKWQGGASVSTISRNLGVAKSTVSDTVKRFKELGHSGGRAVPGRPRSVSTSQLVEVVRGRFRRNSTVAVRKLARELPASATTIRRIVKDVLHLYPYKHRRVQNMTPAQQDKRLDRCKKLRSLLKSGRVMQVLWSDEKKFGLDQVFNRQNDRVYAKNIENANQHCRRVGKSAMGPSVIVWAGITAKGKTPLVFLRRPETMNAATYQKRVLEDTVLPWAQQHFNGEDWIFQQDGAPAHTTRSVQTWCENHFPTFIDKESWPPVSPDLNPMDFSVWGLLEAKVGGVRYKNLDDLEQALQKAWDDIDVEYLRPTVLSVMTRLSRCVAAKGGLFE
jgi:transposase